MLPEARRATAVTSSAAMPPPIRPADVAADRDARDGEGEDEVQDDEDADLRGDLVDAAIARDDERRRHQAEDRAAGADGDVGSAGQEERPERAGQQAGEVDRDEADVPDRGLEQRAQDVEGEHVEQQVDQARVQEAAGDDPEDLVALREDARVPDSAHAPAVGDRVRADAAVHQQLVAALPAQHLGEEGEHVDGEERVGHERLHLAPADPDAHLGALLRALRAAHPDRSRGHALGADRPAAVGARDSGLAPGVPVTGLSHGRQPRRFVGAGPASRG